jgi:glutamine synthetase type III
MTFIDIANRKLLPATLSYASKLADIAVKTGSIAAKNTLSKLITLTDDMGAKLTELEKAASSTEHEDMYATALYFREKLLKSMELCAVRLMP